MMRAYRALALTTLLLVIPVATYAQVKVSVAPREVDGTKPAQVTVTAATDATDADKARLLLATNAKVDGVDAPFPVKAAGGAVTFTPPPKPDGGTFTIKLTDANNATVSEFPLVFRAAPSNSTTPAASSAANGPPTAQEQERQTKLANTTWFYVLVSLTFLGIVGPFVYAIVASVWRGRSDSNPDNRPLGLPIGSFRSILAYSLVAYLGFYVMASVLSLSRFLPPDFLSGIVATVIGFYFGSRSEEAASAEKTASVRGTVTQGTAAARGAVVTFTRIADGVVPYSRITDATGGFELTGAAPGKYKVRATLTGAAAPSDEQQVTLTAGSDHEIALKIPAP